ncbi:FtsX-like permease family protein [Ruminococcus sp. 5_1_39BFAA]|uniref:ABC transporter permease n=1 Tax=Ruminococcus sp. 5_1_39BFAA TaxID=457412 RepID=UPI003563C40E
MKNIIHISFSYLKYYKKQTAALFTGIILSAALLTGMGGLFESGKNAALENARTEYGDWHYCTRGDADWIHDFKMNSAGSGYKIEKTGMETVRRIIEEPFAIELVYADSGYLDMMGRNVIKGYYPQKEDEIAMDIQTLQNLGMADDLGSQVPLDGKVFTLCGIMGDMPEKLPEFLGDFSQVFVNSSLDYGENGTFLYLKFEENRKVYKQLQSFCKNFGISYSDIKRNNGIAGYVGGYIPEKVWEIIKGGLSNQGLGLPYIWGNLNADGQLTETVILLGIAFFGAFIIYSLFQISMIRRMSQYSIMQTLGMTDGYKMGVLLCELGSIGIAGYLVGCVCGNLIAGSIYQKAGRIFILRDQTRHTGVDDAVQKFGVATLPDAGNYQISWHTILWGLLGVTIAVFVISGIFVYRMKKQSIRQMLSGEVVKHPKHKVYSISHNNLTGILTKKFMFSRKGSFIGILLSLSIGSILFLGSFYVTENTKINNELTFKADDGLGSDIQVYIQSDQLTDWIPEDAIKEMERISGIDELHPVRYLLGEIPFYDGTFTWTSYFAETANDESFPPDPQIMEKYNGVAVQVGEDDYKLKVNIYGYDDAMLEDMKDYILNGEINPEQMRRENSVIVKTLMDGQGYYDGVDVEPGDEITLTTVSGKEVPQEALRFQGEKEWYQSKSLKVTALASRPLAKVDTYIGDTGDTTVDIIMTNEQMERNFGVKEYQTASISVNPESEAKIVSTELGKITKEINKCVVKDYSEQIKQQNLYLYQKMFFYYGIAAVLLGISLLHIMNSMQYLIVARKREFGILRAMGITDDGFRKMIVKEGLRYGIYSGMTVMIIYFVVQKILYYFMVHVYLYLHPKAFISWEVLVAVILLNMVICVGVTLMSGRTILREQIIEEIKE